MKRANYRVSRQDQSRMIVPEPAELPRTVSENRRLLNSYDFQVLGRPAAQLRRQARHGLLLIPHNCTLRSALAGQSIDPDRPLILTGHQPEIFHPGVWLKNFLAGNLARTVNGISVNLNVDNDQPHQKAIKAPIITRNGRAARVEAHYLDAPDGLAYEELSESMIRPDLPHMLRQLGVEAALCDAAEEYWQHINAARIRCNYARTVTCARHKLERQAGLDNLEALVSELAQTESYRAFMLDVVCQAQRFHDAYNAALAEFRRVHHERNPAQPLPDLGRDDRRIELPFWIWRTGQPRQRLWVECTSGGNRRLYLDGEESPFVELTPSLLQGEGRAAIDILNLLENEHGIKIRPRALSLTIFARALLGDVFIHGVGGAIYDKVTDEIIRGYWGVEPPAAVMATGTLHLLPQARPVTEDDRLKLIRRLRDIRCNGDKLMPKAIRNSPLVEDLLKRKWQLIKAQDQSHQARRAAWHQLHEINGALAAQLPGEPEKTRQDLETVREQLSDNSILCDREYSLALYPQERLLEFYKRVTTVEAEVIR